VLYGNLVKGDLYDKVYFKRVINGFKPDAVFHFAGSIQVEKSIRDPLMYYKNNVSNTVNLLESIIDNGIHYFIYSSKASV